MKREFLNELFKTHGLEVPKEAIDSIMNENGKDVESVKGDTAKLKTDLATAQTQATELEKQIKQRDIDIAELQKTAATSEETKKTLSEMRTKYEADTKALQEQLETQKQEAEKQLQDQALAHATEDYFKGQPFASELARNAAMSEFKTAGLKLDESGKFLGADDWMKNLRERDPNAFVSEDTNQNQPGAQGAPKLPQFSSARQQAQPPKKPSLGEMMVKKNENPGANINFD